MNTLTKQKKKVKPLATTQQPWQNSKMLVKRLVRFEQIRTKSSKKLWESSDESQSTFQAIQENPVSISTTLIYHQVPTRRVVLLRASATSVKSQLRT